MEEKMALKVCQVCAVDFTVEKFLIPLIDRMSSEGWEVVTVCSSGNSVPLLIENGYNIKTIPIERSMNPFKALRSTYQLYQYFKISKFDIIHVHTPVASLLARIAARLCNSKSYIIYTAHGFYFHDEMSIVTKRFFIFLEKFAGKFTDLLFCQSNEDALIAKIEGIMPEKNIFTIGNGVDCEKFDYNKYKPFFGKIREEFKIPIDAIVIGIVARMVKEKGYIEFLQACINLNSNYSNLHFLLIGDKLDSDHNSGIERYLINAKNELKERLTFLGQRNDIPRLISVMDIFCLPSYREGLPRTIIEAMFLKKPIVATNIRGCREEVIDGQTGILVPLKNVKALTEALDFLISNRIKALKMGESGYQIAKTHFNEKTILDLQINIIKQQLGLQ